jgi:hypothetical protein
LGCIVKNKIIIARSTKFTGRLDKILVFQGGGNYAYGLKDYKAITYIHVSGTKISIPKSWRPLRKLGDVTAHKKKS